ncbi:MAG: tRNA (N(6)-L-threonylcarbamoyladenosine(37)-C(2))-methylthiotransferase MtaB [Elusimicrobiaceae bacterium]|nr:tRNA (N(6)-L-threonylcarbamoyladenosine(37)-C(2))-methylthiotransferase MtaB [Elusimicrobiaceae bacterium]
MKIYIKTFGCRVNQVESEALLEEFLRRGHQIINSPQYADICIINTCSVTRNADKDALKEANLIKRKNPNARLILTGCFARHGAKEILEKVKEAEIVQKENLPQNLFKQNIDWTVKEHHGKTRAFVKIQDGCTNFCTYCIVPFTRPIKTSKPKKIVLEEIKTLIANGYKEIVLTGINIGNYFCTETKTNLAGLVKEIFALDGSFRIRFSSIEIPTVTDELLEVISKAGNKFCNYLHLPLQSGSSKVLKEMHRHYTAEDFEKRVQEIRQKIKDIFIYTDIIAGFPTESLEDFENSIAFVSKIGFAGLHVFSYSPRPMTAAAKLPQLKPAEIKRRADILREEDLILRQKAAESLINTEQEILVEEKSKNEKFLVATAANFQKALVPLSTPKNTLVKVKITKSQDSICYGK